MTNLNCRGGGGCRQNVLDPEADGFAGSEQSPRLLILSSCPVVMFLSLGKRSEIVYASRDRVRSLLFIVSCSHFGKQRKWHFPPKGTISVLPLVSESRASTSGGVWPGHRAGGLRLPLSPHTCVPSAIPENLTLTRTNLTRLFEMKVSRTHSSKQLSDHVLTKSH